MIDWPSTAPTALAELEDARRHRELTAERLAGASEAAERAFEQATRAAMIHGGDVDAITSTFWAEHARMRGTDYQNVADALADLCTLADRMNGMRMAVTPAKALPEGLRFYPAPSAVLDSPTYADTEEELARIDFATRVSEVADRLRVQEAARRLVTAELNPDQGRVVSWGEVDDLAERPWLVPGLLAQCSIGLLVAKRNKGKSMAAVALAGAVATGTDFLGRPTQQGKVLYVFGEGAAGMGVRFAAWAEANGHAASAVRENVTLYTGANLSSPSGVERLRETVAEIAPALVVIDTWSTHSGLQDENDQAGAARVLEDAIKPIAASAAVLILHHPNAESEDTTAPKSRGGSTLPSNVDTVMTLWSDRTHTAAGLEGVDFYALSTEDEHAGKQKDAERETIRGLYIAEGANGSASLACAAGLMTTGERWVAAHMPEGVPMTIEDLVTRSGTPRATIQRHVRNSPRFVAVKQRPGRATLYTRVR